MFADNERISWIQMERQFALAYLGPIVLWTGRGLSGKEGIFSIFLGTGILCIWVFFLLRQVHIFRYPEKYWGTAMSRMLAGIYQIYLILTGGWLIAEISELLGEYFIQGLPMWLVSGILVAVSLGGSQNVQARGRFAQTAWPLVSILTGGMFLLAAFQGEGVEGLEEIQQISWNLESGKNILGGAVWFLAAFLGAVLIPFLVIQVDHATGHGTSLFRTIGRMGLWQAGILLFLTVSFGAKGKEALQYPVLDLMAGVRLPGGFIRRIDLIFLTVILFALLFSLGSIFFYSKYIWQRVGISWGKIPIVALSFLLGTWEGGNWSLKEEYPYLLCYVFLPVFLAVTLCNGFLRKKNKSVRLLFLCGMVLLLSGCQIVEPEKRAYPLVVGLDRQQGEYQVYLGMAQLARSTGQGKEGGEEQQGAGEGAVLLTGKNREEIQKLYDNTRELYLDPGHVQSIIFGKTLLEEEEYFLNVLENMEKDTSLGNSAYAFVAEDVGAVMGENGVEVTSLGEFLSGIYENRTHQEKPTTLGNIYREMHNRGRIPRLPQVTADKGQIFVDK